ncbi:4a-hydroxytetrahydrobiopterin dehydratase [Halorhodospira halophila]|uniref:Putative pterin-4-alpha-carbinolamine dehydratase n=1 Tax=Halorhodospira halophila (strain DSM 244 / SL1) TaxID=349124 RepID=PHS_HALHL|nr:4a-hydroxytetrahydrobiopterin dehydratase [Halorhodospira halophila]A1WWH9.1 RecName: Full=Putative pterin-4-alpha-carbinolamine dehydratase; Short=PHS; AltName: Full=4-alpha-hydroxy-tetrahydropterin dehydratase; AltName: Full=Pterin carbinolamine dehydratase; Short=PCD [Halorhodospira halophila SL1]ABM62041.1 pterin-4-alpha-carbinolamine dehydratase [Halorhodospira halophila SL1]MBK1728418.1 pterin-4-alpha-carbinolamine dehydratase [Halorhodospira halophila]
MSLTDKTCVPCQGGVAPMDRQQAEQMLVQVPEWSLDTDARMIYRRFKFRNFIDALSFVNRVTEVAEAEDHHPDILLGYGYAEVRIQTHKIEGLHENDFILAAKVDALGA